MTRIIWVFAFALLLGCGGSVTGAPQPVPTRSTATASDSFGTGVMVSVFGELGTRTFVFDVDDTNPPTVFAEGMLVLGRAPSSDAFVALTVRNGLMRMGDGYRVLDESGAPKSAGYESACVPLLLDDDRVVLCEQSDRSDPTAQGALVAVDVLAGTRSTLGEGEGHFWDDVPLRRTPDGEALIFHWRTPDSRGLYRVPIRGGTFEPFMPDGVLATFTTSGEEAFVLARPHDERQLWRYAYDGQRLTNPRPVLDGGLLALPVDDRRALVFAHREDRSSLHVVSLHTGASQLLDPSVHIGEASTMGMHARVAGDRVVYFGRRPDGLNELRIADLDGAAPPRALLDQRFSDGIIIGTVD